MDDNPCATLYFARVTRGLRAARTTVLTAAVSGTFPGGRLMTETRYQSIGSPGAKTTIPSEAERNTRKQDVKESQDPIE